MSGGWAGHRGGYDTPAWRALRRQALIRDHYRCQWVEHGIRCLAPGGHVDHILNRAAGGLDVLENVQTLCRSHHSKKTSLEGNSSPRRFRERRPREAHPGVVQ